MTFTDKENRTIHLSSDEWPDIVASHNGNEIGRFEFNEIELDPKYGQTHMQLMYMGVNSEYQKSGIGTEMMRFAVDTFGGFSRPGLYDHGDRGVESHMYYTEEGRALVSSCIEKGILAGDEEEVESEFEADFD